MVWCFWIESICLLVYTAELFALCICAPICLQVLCALMYVICVLCPVPQGVIQNGARMMSQGLFPGIRPLPINPIVSRTATVRSVLSHQITLSTFPVSADSLHDWQVYQPIRIMLTLQYFGSYLICPFDSVKSDYFLLEKSSQVIHRHQHTILFERRRRSSMHDVTWIIDHIH